MNAQMATAPTPAPYTIDEETTMNTFHSFLTLALAQAKAERLLDDETLASAEADLMVAGPALCLYFAALRSSTTPPSIPLPRQGLPRDTPPLVLSADTCPPVFKAFFSIWSTLTPQIQALPPEEKHDLARLICGHQPLSQPSQRVDSIKRMALDMRAVAIEISQRRTFQERYQADLQAALDHGRPPSDGQRTPSPFRATFVPPPGYAAEKPLPLSPTSNATLSPPGSAQPSPRRPSRPLTPTSPTSGFPGGFHIANPDVANGNGAARAQTYRAEPPSPPPRGHTRNQSSQGSMFLGPPPRSAGAGGGPSIRRPASPTILTPSDPAILTIRETLYAQLADVIARDREIRHLLKTDPGRAYFASVGSAILEFSLYSLTPEGNVKAVLGAELRLQDIPPPYVPLMKELQAIAARSREFEAEDDKRAIDLLTAGEEELPEPRMDRVRRMLIKGVARGWEELQRETGVSSEETDAMAGAAFESQHRRSARDPLTIRGRSRDRSPEGTVLQLANRINALALRMMSLPAFRERQDAVFKVLAGVR